jgi:hypothetical protein
MRPLDFFSNLPNPYSRSMALGPTQPLREMSTWNPPGGGEGSKGRQARKSINLTVIYEPFV